MNEDQTISWIFLATALASKVAPADFRGITAVADGINHAIPTHKETQTSISWLNKKGLINNLGNKYELTLNGKMEYEKASSNTRSLLKIWENLEVIIKSLA